jgi:hypothetical protein
MIEQTSFLGMPLRTRRERRLLVIGYYVVLFLFSALGLWKSHGNIVFLLPQVLTFGGMLGGIKIGGPVKPYSEAMIPVGGASGIQTLNLEGRKVFDDGLYPSPLDERERSQRNFAHYHAYRILRWTLGRACFLYWLSFDWNAAWISARGPILAWILIVYVLSLPQSVLLWTEPEGPAGELAMVRQG